jgi:hypothetical protein
MSRRNQSVSRNRGEERRAERTRDHVRRVKLSSRPRDVNAGGAAVRHREGVGHENESGHRGRHVLAKLPEVVGARHRLDEVL